MERNLVDTTKEEIGKMETKIELCKEELKKKVEVQSQELSTIDNLTKQIKELLEKMPVTNSAWQLWRIINYKFLNVIHYF